jgi:hypothetical protein
MIAAEDEAVFRWLTYRVRIEEQLENCRVSYALVETVGRSPARWQISIHRRLVSLLSLYSPLSLHRRLPLCLSKILRSKMHVFGVSPRFLTQVLLVATLSFTLSPQAGTLPLQNLLG